MLNDNRDRDEVPGFRYYDLKGEPVRVALNERGDAFGADSFNAETNSLERNAALISQVETDPHADEITEAAFYQLCATLHQKKSPPEHDLAEGPGGLEL